MRKTITLAELKWNDGSRNVTYVVSPPAICDAQNLSPTFSQQNTVIHVAAGTPISFAVAGNDLVDAFNYYLVLEQL
jgi:hypothetical protein